MVATFQRYKPCCLHPCMRRMEVEERNLKGAEGTGEMVHARCPRRLRAFQYSAYPVHPAFGSWNFRTVGPVWQLERSLRHQEAGATLGRLSESPAGSVIVDPKACLVETRVSLTLPSRYTPPLDMSAMTSWTLGTQNTSFFVAIIGWPCSRRLRSILEVKISGPKNPSPFG